MCFYIGIEDLAANALIEILTKNSEKRFVSYEELENYGPGLEDCKYRKTVNDYVAID